MTEPEVLSRGEWESVLFQMPDQVRHLVTRLAIHHGHLIAAPAICPLCAAKNIPTQSKLELS
jgi:hypothetical protein